ncbi:MAG: hypothetical protein NTZ05_15950 [Chloroflexi bacterium]|nr:hypothetical protein [Chloroflexota bacterium]
MTKRTGVRWLTALAAGMVLASLAAVVFAAPQPAATPTAQIVATVQTAADRWEPERDPLVQTATGAQAKTSNVHGIEVDGERYYYRMIHDASFDPKSRGEAGRFETVTTLDAGTPFELEIYRWVR